VIVTALIATGVVLIGLTVVLVVRDRRRDRSACQAPQRDAFDRALSTGIPGYHHEQDGPGA